MPSILVTLQSAMGNTENRGYETIQQTSRKLPANVFKIHMNCWTFAAICYNGAGSSLDRVNTPLET